MVILKPDLGERVVDPVPGDVARRKVRVDVHDGNGRSLFVEQPPRRLGRKKHIVVRTGPPCPQAKR